MKAPLPALLIAGFSTAGKGAVIDALVRHKPADETWALIRPGSMLGLARAAVPGLLVETVAPGCPCCTGQTPFSVGLTTLLRKLRDQPVTRLLIEGGSEGHIASVAQVLAGDNFREHVQLAHALAVIDPTWLVNTKPTAQEALRELVQAADSLVASPWNENAGARSELSAYATNVMRNAARSWAPLMDGMLDPGFAHTVLSSTHAMSSE